MPRPQGLMSPINSEKSKTDRGFISLNSLARYYDLDSDPLNEDWDECENRVVLDNTTNLMTPDPI